MISDRHGKFMTGDRARDGAGNPRERREGKTKLRVRTVREMGQALRQDWDNYKVGLLIAVAVTVAANLLGHGVCPSREFLGLPCPGCGMTRSILLILQGRFYESWLLQPFGYAWLTLAAVFAVERYVLESRQKIWKGLLTVICAGMVALYIYRMITMFPHTEPMTYYEGNLLRRVYGWGQAAGSISLPNSLLIEPLLSVLPVPR